MARHPVVRLPLFRRATEDPARLTGAGEEFARARYRGSVRSA